MPKITVITPSTGVAGTPIKIAGEGFGASRGQSLLEIGGKNVNTVTWGDKEITCQIPDGVSETPHIRVVLPGGIASDVFQFNPPKNTPVPVPAKNVPSTQVANSPLAPRVNVASPVPTIQNPADPLNPNDRIVDPKIA